MGRPLHPEFPNESARERYARELTQPRDVVIVVDQVAPSDVPPAADRSPAVDLSHAVSPKVFEAVPPARGERRAKKPTAKKAKSKR